MTTPVSNAPAPLTPPPAASPGASVNGGPESGAALSRELGDFLIEFSIGIHKNAIYPQGHPLLDQAVNGVARKLGILLNDTRPTLSIGVARRQLIIEGVATDANHPVLRELASKLHRHSLGAVRFTYGVTREEIASLLALVSIDAQRMDLPLGLQGPEVLQQWERARLFPLTFEQLELLDEGPEVEGEGSGAPREGARSAQLWIGLARAALAADSMSDEPPPSTDPVIVAKAIDENSKDTAYDQVVVGYMLQIAEELKTKQGAESAALQRRVSRLVETLQPETLERLLRMGGDVAQRTRFVLDASAGMAVDAVVDIVKAVANSSDEQQTVSHSMVRLLQKFAAHAELGAGPTRPEADEALREHTRRLIGEWSLTDPNPEAYREALEGMARATPLFNGVDAYPCEADRMISMALEIGIVGDSVWRALDEQIRKQRLRPMMDLIDSAPDGWGKDALWSRIATTDFLYVLLAERPIDLEAVRRMSLRMGAAAVPPLLDTIEAAADRVPPPLLDTLAELGDAAANAVAERLPGERWITQRQLLVAMSKMSAWPPSFTPLDYVRHPDPLVRREALRIMVRSPELRVDGICVGVTDVDENMVRVALSAAVNACPVAAVQPILARADDPELSPELRAMAVRVVASCPVDAVLEYLIRRVSKGKRLFRLRLQDKTPEMVSALAGLAAFWSDAEGVAPILELAMKSSDAEIKGAVTARRGAGRLSVAMAPVE